MGREFLFSKLCGDRERATASLGYPFISVNTRMHDIGSTLAYPTGKAPLRGGSYWGQPSKELLDIASWVTYAGSLGYSRVVLVGHSAGGPPVRRYQADRNDPRVMGIVMASVGIGPAPPRPDPERLKVASEMVASGRGKEFLPNFRLSAQTYEDYGVVRVF